MFSKMLKIQDGLNFKAYDESWREKGKSLAFDYCLAASQEIGEYLNSYGYSWWSKSPQDLDNCITELVDAWHFIMSSLLIDDFYSEIQPTNYDRISRLVNSQYEESHSSKLEKTNKKDVLDEAKVLQILLLVGNTSYIESFFILCSYTGVDLELLYCRYLGKSVLNKFRQLNGYKQGTYSKTWSIGETKEEDNYYLSQFITTFIKQKPTADVELTEQEILAFLETTYASRTK